MPEIAFDNDKNAVKIGEVDELEAWYFHDRGSLLVGQMFDTEFSPAFAVDGSLLTEVAKRFEERFDAELNDLGQALVDINESDKEGIVDRLSKHGFTHEQVARATNLDE